MLSLLMFVHIQTGIEVETSQILSQLVQKIGGQISHQENEEDQENE